MPMMKLYFNDHVTDGLVCEIEYFGKIYNCSGVSIRDAQDNLVAFTTYKGVDAKQPKFYIEFDVATIHRNLQNPDIFTISLE